jgi:hypothetical protein
MVPEKYSDLTHAPRRRRGDQDAETELGGGALAVRIPMRLQRRGGRKLIVTPEGEPVPTPRRHVDQGARPYAQLATQDRERSGEVDHRPSGAGGRDRRLRLPAPAAQVPRAGHCGSDSRRAAAEGAQARGVAGEWAAWVGGAAERLGFSWEVHPIRAGRPTTSVLRGLLPLTCTAPDVRRADPPRRQPNGLKPAEMRGVVAPIGMSSDASSAGGASPHNPLSRLPSSRRFAVIERPRLCRGRSDFSCTLATSRCPYSTHSNACLLGCSAGVIIVAELLVER